jgi:hypothetical protein
VIHPQSEASKTKPNRLPHIANEWTQLCDNLPTLLAACRNRNVTYGKSGVLGRKPRLIIFPVPANPYGKQRSFALVGFDRPIMAARTENE